MGKSVFFKINKGFYHLFKFLYPYIAVKYHPRRVELS